ncbi:hypothetical protein BDY19DRAFT_993774 [Irpex rosettiformis]|uniref:Uncharacterized protein n=1 Tax=Irpex rosettiformis TaxID=378272 RepID=A0ACB8U483_9APHY|nr:hypothetical protein BDY19DRAFT_993774 [Irpex rosettiformis]
MPPKNSKAKAKPSGIPKPKRVDPEPVRVPDNPRAAQRAELLATRDAPTRALSDVGGIRTRSQSRAGSTTSTTEVRNTLRSVPPPPAPAPPVEQPIEAAEAGNAEAGDEKSFPLPPIPGTFDMGHQRSPSRQASVDSFDDMYLNQEELGPQDSASNVPEATNIEQRTERRVTTVETIPEEEVSIYQSTFPRMNPLQSTVNSVFSTLRMQQEEIEELRAARLREESEVRALRRAEVEEIRAVRAAELEEIRMRRRDEEQRYHHLMRVLLHAQQQMITVANTQGLEVPEIRDMSLGTAPSRESTRTTPRESEEEQISPMGRIGATNTPPHRHGPDTPTRLRNARLPHRGEDVQEFLQRMEEEQRREAGRPALNEEVDRLSRRQHPVRVMSEAGEEPPSLMSVGRDEELPRTVVDGRRGPSASNGSSSASSDPSHQGRGGGRPTSRVGSAENNPSQTREVRVMSSASRPPRAYTGHQFTAPSGVNPRYLRPVVEGQPNETGKLRGTQEQSTPAPFAYESGLRAWIVEVLEQDLNFNPEELPTLNRNIKIAMPSAYEGQDDINAFQDWVIDITRFFQLTRMVGRQMDSQRVMVMGDMLKGEAARWYNTEVRAPERMQRQWSLKSVLFALQERFVHEATAQVAAEKYEAIRFNPTTGVAGLANELRKFAGRMVEPPDGYSMRRKLLKELPSSVMVPLVRNQHVTAENSTFSQMVREALAVENANRALELHQKQRSTKGEPIATQRQSVPVNGTPRRRPAMGASGRLSTPPTGQTGSQSATPTKGVAPAGNTASSASRAVRWAGPPARASTGVSEAVRQSTIQCYGCGAVGHVRSSPACPMNKPQGLRCMEEETNQGEVSLEPTREEEQDEERAADMTINLNHEDVGEEYVLPLEGEQYEEDYPEEIYEDPEYYSAGEELRAMRIATEEAESTPRLQAMMETKGQRVAMRVTSQAKPRPYLNTQCVLVEGVVNGLKGKILLDSGSSINAMSPSFATVADVAAFPLESPVGLQLGCVGSRSKINFGITTRLRMGGKEHDTYFDVVNLDHYDMVLGMPFLKETGTVIDFAALTVRVGQQMVPTLRGGGMEIQPNKRRVNGVIAVKQRVGVQAKAPQRSVEKARGLDKTPQRE